MMRRTFAASVVLATAVAFPFLWAVLIRELPRPASVVLDSVLDPDSLPDVWPLTVFVGMGFWGYMVGRGASLASPWRLAVAEGLAGAVSVNLVLSSAFLDLLSQAISPEPVGPWYLVALPVITAIEAGLAGAILGLAAKSGSATIWLGSLGAAATALPAIGFAGLCYATGLSVGSGNAAMAYVTGGSLLVGVATGGSVLAFGIRRWTGSNRF